MRPLASMQQDGRENDLSWRDDLSAAEWDHALAALGGHPLQSALWGNARRGVDGIEDYRVVAVRERSAVGLFRIERRALPGGRWVGWCPKGPAADAYPAAFLASDIAARLRAEGMVLFVTDVWAEIGPGDIAGNAKRPRTIWLDLTIGEQALRNGLEKQWRYGVGRAERLGVKVSPTRDGKDIERFFALCTGIGSEKGFETRTSLPLMKSLLGNFTGGDVEAVLFCAWYEEALAAGALIIRCGRSAHYFWGGTDRDASNARAGEAVQWAAIAWALERGCTRYDLEGIDPRTNPGTYAFKKKMGGREVVLHGKSHHPLGWRGRVVTALDKWRA